MSNDDGVRELAGLSKTKNTNAVEVFEDEAGSLIGLVANRFLTVAQARKIGDDLYRLSDRTEKRLSKPA